MKISDMTIRNCVFAFKCNAKWEEMMILFHLRDETNEVRFCDSCQKEVHFCNDDNQLVTNVRLNRCIAIKRDSVYSVTEVGDPILDNDYDDEDDEDD
jgi:hypothetical protein